MQTARFRNLDPDQQLATVTVDGTSILLPRGIPLAAALLAHGHDAFHRSVKLGEPRGPWCLMGTCMQCVATVDGSANERTCRTPVRDGMVVTLAGGAPR